MARIPVHTTQSAPEQSRDQLKSLEAKFGKVINIHGGMAHSPVVLQSHIAIQQVIADYGSFDARTREAIALAVGNADDCNYCQAAHTGGGKAAGLTNDEMIAIRTRRGGLRRQARGPAHPRPPVHHQHRFRRGRLLAGCPRRGVERRAGHRAVRARHAEPAHELLQPLRGDRSRPSGRSGALTVGFPRSSHGRVPPEQTSSFGAALTREVHPSRCV